MSTTNILDLNNRIDELVTSYPATQVMMSDRVTSVEDALDGLTVSTIGAEQTLTHDIEYTTTKDGYFKVKIDSYATAGSKYVMMYVNGKTFMTIANVSGLFQEGTVFIRKGSVIKFVGSDSNITYGYFYPLQ